MNPAAGGGHAADSLPSLQAFAVRNKWSVEFRITQTVQDLRAQALAAAATGYKRFLVLGGDGSFQDIVNVLAPYPEAILGILPAGGGNDLADSLGLPHDPLRAAELLLNGEPEHMDAARVVTSDGKTRLFTGGGGAGVDAQAAYFASTTFRRLTGRPRYLLSAARALVEYQPLQVRLEYRTDDGTTGILESTSMFVAILNTPSYGAGLRFAPDAVINDGILNLVVVEDMPVHQLLKALPRLIVQGEVRSPRVKRFAVRQLSITTCEPRLFHGDGEVLGYTPLSIEVAPKAFRILCPPGSPLSSKGDFRSK